MRELRVDTQPHTPETPHDGSDGIAPQELCALFLSHKRDHS